MAPRQIKMPSKDNSEKEAEEVFSQRKLIRNIDALWLAPISGHWSLFETIFYCRLRRSTVATSAMGATLRKLED